MTLTKSEIVDKITEKMGLSKNQSVDLVEVMLELIKKTLENGESVLISGFGKFNVKAKNKRMGRNPATGDQMLLDARKVITFTCSQKLRSLIDPVPPPKKGK